ncbi:MAG: DUF1836 domain-containing protein [Lachnospiraceae bacterium]|nr:DUF1836 domain-containing protein [Lachnospiraceae bacterium]
MSVQWKNYMKELQAALRNTDYIKPNDIPNIDLYMDQVTKFMDENLESSKRFDSDKLLTKTMINNYTKNDLLPPPEKKKYSKDHMYMLLFIYYLKNFLSIRDVKKIISPMSDMFFDSETEISLEDIYGSIYAIEEEQSISMAKDVMVKFMKSRRTFPEVQGEKEREYLQIFSFIAMLSFDVYLKKNLIESIIDDILGDIEDSDEKESKEVKKTSGKEVSKDSKKDTKKESVKEGKKESVKDSKKDSKKGK